MRSINNTSLSVGLVNVPVKMYAASESHDVKFGQRHGGTCGGAVGRRDVCKDCGAAVDYGDIVNGIEVDGKTVTLSRDEIAAVESDAGKAITILSFAHADEINPLTLGAPYYLEPDGAGLEGYALLRETLTEGRHVGVCQYTQRGKTHLCVLRAVNDVLVVQHMLWADELRAPEFAVLGKQVTLRPALLKMAQQLVESMLEPFNAADYVDTYTQRLTEVVNAKAAGAAPAAAADAAMEDVSDLIAALEASMKRHPAGKRRGKTPPRTSARKTAPRKTARGAA
jgi:DNA end-binding protein Ku